MDLMKMLQGQLTEQVIGQLSAQHELPKQQTGAAANAIMSVLMGGLAKNAATPQGAAALNKALDKHHDGGVLDNIMGLLGGGAKENPAPPAMGFDAGGLLGGLLGGGGAGNILGSILGGGSAAPAKATDGAGILGHILGAQQDGTIAKIAGMLGMDQGKILAMMMQLAPMVMGVLGQQKQAQGLGASALSAVLANSVSGAAQAGKNPFMSIATSMLDKNGDGNVTDDLMNMGKDFLGGMFKKK
ncbi:MAG: hypothetical protein RIS64_1132 [Bacteroidota bacterium]|jgi:hypothetical protein